MPVTLRMKTFLVVIGAMDDSYVQKIFITIFSQMCNMPLLMEEQGSNWYGQTK